MKFMNDLIGQDLKQIFPDRDWSRCSIGEPVGDGIKIGFEGWGEPDIALSPSLPLDMSIERLGLKGAFKHVYSQNLLNYVHGDCVLTHTARGLRDALANGGELKVKILATAALATNALLRLDCGDFVGCQLLEKLCFKLTMDSSGIIFQQTFLDERRLVAAFSGCLHITKNCTANSVLRPDDVRIPEVTDEKWKSSATNMTQTESLKRDWPTCACCRRVSTKADWNRNLFSRYCRNHYQVARELWQSSTLEAYSIEGVLHG